MLRRSDERKAEILAAAERVMSQKGLIDSTISEIAREAGVGDSLIYQYYKGKEDLLFSIPGERMKEVLSLLEEQLQGIRDPESRLGKMIWFHLRYNDEHPGYARILLLECRSSADFYTTPAYQLIRKYSGILLSILQEGVDCDVFRSDFDIRLVRDVILGFLDAETLGCLASKEIDASTKDFDDVMSLIRAMVARRAQHEVSKSDSILLAAEYIFTSKGFSKAKIADIAQLAGVAEGTVYDYFDNKEDLLLSIPVKRFRQFLDELPETFEIKRPLRKLRRFTKYHFLLFLTERNFSKLFVLQLLLNQRFYGSKAFESFTNYFRVIEEIIREGIEDGSFRRDVNPRVFRNMFLGAFSHLALRWLIVEKEGKIDKMQELVEVTDLLSSAVLEIQ
jgi:TetR/AcrR family fatty acid metabolism transcriptional regulator